VNVLRWIAIALVSAPAVVLADAPGKGPVPRHPHPGEFTFVRVEYDSVGGYGESWYNYDGRTWQRWETDYPEAEENLVLRMSELTNLKVNQQPISLRLTDPRINDYPLIYMCDVGWMDLRKTEVTALRQYLLNGGFLWIDDFWGHAEWMNLEMQMDRVFPELHWRDIPNDHPILTTVFELKECPQVPAKVFWDSTGETYDDPFGHREPTGGVAGVKDIHFKGLFHNGRLITLATHNCDIGDGWERETEDERFFQIFSTKAYALTINIIVYALTH
jgi:hypothetical protein